MSARELITEHLDLWTGAVTKKSSSGRGSNGKVELTGVKRLRELILELAIRGKLVEQKPTSESVDDLLLHLEKCKADLRERWSVRTAKPLSETTKSTPAHNLPKGWASVLLDEIGITQIGLTYSPKDVSVSGTPVLRSSNIQNGKLDFNDLVRVRSTVPSSIYVEEGDLLICARNGSKGLVGKNAMLSELSEPMTFGAFMAIYRSPINPYIQVFLNSPMFREELEGTNTTTINQITQNKLRSTRIPLPPLEEQHRIIQKVDELMALCDRLEQQTSDQLEAHETLVDTLLSTLTQSENATELADNWARLAAHFDTLFTTEQSIDKLKQTILQLAVMGRLVEQDAGDEPAATLLQSIESQKGELIKSGTIKNSKPLPPVSQEDYPFRLPNSWRCHRLGGLVTKLGSGSTPRGGQRAYVDDGVPFFRSQNVWNDGLRLEDIVYISENTHARMSNTVVYPKDILLNITGASLGRSTIFPDHIPEANVSQHVTIIRLIEPAMTSFVHLCIQSPLIQSLVWGRQVGMAIEGLSKKVLERFEMPIPPLEEQHRIVQKVDELMALCDQLKARLNQASETRCQLAEAVVASALG